MGRWPQRGHQEPGQEKRGWLWMAFLAKKLQLSLRRQKPAARQAIIIRCIIWVIQKAGVRPEKIGVSDRKGPISSHKPLKIP